MASTRWIPDWCQSYFYIRCTPSVTPGAPAASRTFHTICSSSCRKGPGVSNDLRGECTLDPRPSATLSQNEEDTASTTPLHTSKRVPLVATVLAVARTEAGHYSPRRTRDIRVRQKIYEKMLGVSRSDFSFLCFRHQGTRG